MKSLFGVKFNWPLYFLLVLTVRFIWLDISWFSFFAICITLHQFLLLFYSIGAVIPIRYLAGSLMCVQMLLGPTFAYNGLDAYQTDSTFTMKIDEASYFGYMIPAMILFITGLHISALKLKGEILNIKEIVRFIDNAGTLPYIFIAIGFLSSVISVFFSSTFGFVFYLLSSFKFIGAFMLILGTKQLKTWILVLVYGSIIATSLGQAMFHDLLTWLIMLGAVLAMKYKPTSTTKAIAAFGFILMVVVIQQVKGDYRKAAWGGEGGGSGFESFENAITKKNKENSLFSFESLAVSNVRINQGFIITNIMSTVPARVPYENGKQLLKILEAAFLPRFLAPNKLNAGDRTIFMKYSGMFIAPGTSMALSSPGDAYVNFGTMGGTFFMFFLGLLFSEVLNKFHQYSKYYPVLLLFTPMVFYYPIRPDCELQTSLGHLVKSCFLIFMMVQVWKHRFKRVAVRRSTVQEVPKVLEV